MTNSTNFNRGDGIDLGFFESGVSMQLGVIKESQENESRVALVPEVIDCLIKELKLTVLVEEGAGFKAGFLDQDYVKVGAKVVSRSKLLQSDYLVGINGGQFFKEDSLNGKVVIGLFDPFFNREGINKLKEQNTTAVSLELIPRISRAQSMDVLSSQANIAGYMAVLHACSHLSKVMPLMMTAAGTIKPAKVLILGGGVAGLQAIATAKRLGALVFCYDVRHAVKEQVESLGAKFIDLKLSESGEGQGGYAKALSEDAQNEQRKKLTESAKDMDVIITTAQIPGKKAPLLLNDNIFSLLKKDSVIIDMAAASGGNVSGSVPNKWVDIEGVKLYGADNLSRMVPKDASFTFSKNIKALLELLLSEKDLPMDDEIVKDAVICHQGQWVNQHFHS